MTFDSGLLRNRRLGGQAYRIAFVSQRDPTDVAQWSGTLFFLHAALQRAGHHLQLVAPISSPIEPVLRMASSIRGRFCALRSDPSRRPVVSRALARRTQKALAGNSLDFVLCASSSIAAYLDVAVPVLTWEDAVFAGIHNYYFGGRQWLAPRSVADGHFIQQRALERATLSVFSSEWAARSAIEHYGADPEKVRVIPFGANLASPPSGEIVEQATQARLRSPECRLLFVGVEWERKGGDTVLQVAEILRRSGVRVVVDLVGVRPPRSLPDYVHVHGFVSKASESGRALLDSLFLSAHFLFVPSIAECFGLVYAEASAFGVPSLARRTGGVPSVVLDGENGWLLPSDASPEAFSALIHSVYCDADVYVGVSRRARALYEERFNWDAAIAALEREVAAALSRHPRK